MKKILSDIRKIIHVQIKTGFMPVQGKVHAKSKIGLLLLILFANTWSYSQRWYAINDSTSYSLNDVTITVGRHKVYLNQDNNLTLIRDFSTNNPQIPEDYIRDFDFIDSDTWYVLVGSRYIGNKTELYKTNDAGNSWEPVFPQCFTVPSGIDGTADSINQVQFLNGRIYLFDEYYISRVFYSDDLGQTWTHWFQCYWSHYYQMYACGTDLYIHGLAGDGFRAYMVQVPTAYFGQQNIFTTNVGGCNNGGTVGCYYAPSNATVPEVSNHFSNFFNATICSLHTGETTNNSLKISRNPVADLLVVEGLDSNLPVDISVLNSLGQICLEIKDQSTIEVSKLQKGVYFLKISQFGKIKALKFLKT